MDEDAKDAMENGGEGDLDGKDVIDASSGGREREPATLRSIRALTQAVDGDVEISVEVELIAEKLRSMGGAGCKIELWRTVR